MVKSGELQEELATLESLDSGAVYTLALKTHIGMSIDTWRYFAGWCDKIQVSPPLLPNSLTPPPLRAQLQGSTIPINHARPNRNLTITKKEPIGVCALVPFPSLLPPPLPSGRPRGLGIVR